MRYLIYTLLLFGIISCSEVTENKEIDKKDFFYEESDLEKENLLGDVKSIKTSIYEALTKNGNIVKGRVVSGAFSLSEVEYDNLGNMLFENWKYPNGDMLSKSEYKYDNDKNNTELIKYDSKDSVVCVIKFKYDSVGKKVLQEVSYEPGIVDFKIEWDYDYQYKEKQETAFTRDGSLMRKTVTKFEPNSNKVLEISNYSANNQLDEKHTYIYNKEGNVLEEYIKKAWKDNTSVNSWEYDSLNNPVFMAEDNISGGLKWFHFYDYEYDDKGNWIKKIEFEQLSEEKKVARTITEREIAYF